MKIANISYTKNHLSALLERVREGETVLIVDRKKPIARLEPAGELSSEGVPAWVQDLIRRGVVVPPTKPLDLNRLHRLPLGKARRGGDIVRALREDREDRV